MAGRLLATFAAVAATLIAALACAGAGTLMVAAKQPERHGAFGPYGPRMCEQLWIMPSGDPAVDLRATVFRPAASPAMGGCSDPTPRPVAIINHGTDPNTRLAVSMPVFFWLSHWFVDRGYIVVVPQRRGYGATGGAFAEGRDTCRKPQHYAAAQTIADDIEAVARFVAGESFAAGQPIVAVGISSGGWGALALGGRAIPELRAVVNFAGGRGAYAWGRPGAICDPQALADAARRLGRDSLVPSMWLYAANDTFFPPRISEGLFQAFKTGGGAGDFELLPPMGFEGHAIVDDEASWSVWGDRLEAFLRTVVPSGSDQRTVTSAQAALFDRHHDRTGR